MKRHSLNFLLELLLAIVMFTMCSIVFVNLFASASKKNQMANIKSEASYMVESIAEEIRIRGKYDVVQKQDGFWIDIDEKDGTYLIRAIDEDGNVLEKIQVKYLGDVYA